MPWMERCEMEQRMEFVVLARERGANISELCRQFNISRKTGYKLMERYESEGWRGVEPRSRRPHSSPCALSGDVVAAIVRARNRKTEWGAEKLQKLVAAEVKEVPSIRSIERVLERCALSVPRRKRRRKHLPQAAVVRPAAPNEVWTIDFKGDWRMKNGERCYPLTLRDEYSKFIIDICALSGTGWEATKERLTRCFERFGLPKYIRSDNGNPFACIRSVAGLTRLSAWWVKLGIFPNRIPPASPQFNGGHERMHRDMAMELELTPQANLADEQHRFDDWRAEYNSLRPHQALGLKTPEKCYRKSSRRYNKHEPAFAYDKSFEQRLVGNRGMVAWKNNRIFLSNALRSETVAFKPETNDLLSVWFCELLLGYTDKNFRSPLGGSRPS